MTLAADVGMTVCVSGLSNPDFRRPWPAAGNAPRQRLLPVFESVLAPSRMAQPIRS
jgi:hypothetical protein